MSETLVDIELAKKEDVPVSLTTEQMNNIKSQFHPSNTANVNITLCHIYDEDEHVVGEWRKTIDGVKKKKPVYEKYTDVSTTLANDWSTIISKSDISPSLEEMVNVILYTDNEVVYSATRLYSNNIQSYVHGLAGAVISRILIDYTKTTDEWEEV